MRSDCISTDSIGVLAPVAGAEVRIVSPVLNDSANTESIFKYDSGSDKFEPFLDTFSLIDRYSYICIFVSILMVATMISFEASGLSSSLHIVKRISKQYALALWCIFALVVRQERPSARTAILNMVWLIMAIGIFIISSGYFLNLMGTEQVAKRGPDQINTLNDVIGSKFERIEPTLVTNAFTYAMNKLVKPGSNEEKVFKKLRRNESNFISVEANKNKDNKTIFFLVMEMKDCKNRYFLVEDYLVTQMKPVLCHYSPENTKTLRTSMETMLGGLLVAPYAKTMDIRLKKYTEYRLSNQFEMGISTYESRDFVESLAQLTGEWNFGKPNSTMCLLGLTEDGQVDRCYEISYPSCTEIVTTSVRAGTLDDSGNYTGLTGMLQRGEVDYVSTVIRSDCLVGESLGVMATYYEAGVRIISATLNGTENPSLAVNMKSSERFEPLLDTLALVDRWTCISILAAILTVATIISAEYAVYSMSSMTWTRLPERFTFAIWNIFELLVSQGKFKMKKQLTQYLWLIFTMGLFVIVSGWFLNLLRTEKVAQRNVAQIETIADIVGNQFNYIKPTILVNSYTYALNKTVRNGSDEAEIFRKLHKRKDNVISATSGKDNIILMMYDMIEYKNRYVLFEEVLWRNLRPLLCRCNPKNVRASHTSRDTVLDGLLVVPYRKNVDLRFKKYIEYRLINKFEMGLSAFRILCCTEIITTNVKAGVLDEKYGNYSGMAGMLQRGEVEYASTELRADCLESESLGVMATYFEAGARIISATLNDTADKQHTERFEPLLDTLALVDRFTYICLCEAILAISVILSIVQMPNDSVKLECGRFFGRFVSSLWKIFELIVGQGKFKLKRMLLQSLWLNLTIGLFIIVSGLFLNLFRTEKVAKISQDQVETIDDIVGDKFNGMKPTILDNSYTYSLSKIVKNGSKEAEVFNKLKLDAANIISVTSKQRNVILFMYDIIEHKDRYAIFEEVLWRKLRPVICRCNPGNVKASHTSKETILDGLLIVPYRKNVDHRFKAYVEYRLKNKFEMGLSASEYYGIFVEIAKLAQQYEVFTEGISMCLYGMNDEATVAEMQFKLQHSKMFLRLLIVIVMLSVLVHFVEILASTLKKHLRGRNSPCVQKSVTERNVGWA
ncbi:hypothetical protein HDE_00980 [Halotydeus destructor]|nr:hypothetical protein HDE_00980 [Halotydeus destructor]